MEKYGKLVFEESGFRFVITKQLLESGQTNLLLDAHEIAIDCPVALIQGMQDKSVPYQKAVKIAEKLRSTDVTLLLLKNSDHRLNTDEDAVQIRRVLDFLCKKILA
jgi:esterase/lipase